VIDVNPAPVSVIVVAVCAVVKALCIVQYVYSSNPIFEG
jgi:hypothetical protein